MKFYEFTAYKCTAHECAWSDYQRYSDWDFFIQNGSNITDCGQCMALCDGSQNCTSLECGPDQLLPDGTIINGYCSYWTHGLCESATEFTLNPHNYIWTCKKEKTGNIYSYFCIIRGSI